MGYQESFVTAPDFDALLARIRTLGKRHFVNAWMDVVGIITLKRDIVVNLEQGTLALVMLAEALSGITGTDVASPVAAGHGTQEFKAGTRFVFVVGERHWQIHGKVSLGNHELYFAEEFPSEIFAASKPCPDQIRSENEFTIQEGWKWPERLRRTVKTSENGKGVVDDCYACLKT